MIQMIGFWISLVLMHPLHLGVIHIDVDEKSVANIEVRLFTDDLNAAIVHSREQAFSLEYGNNQSVQIVCEYLEEKLQISNRDEKLKLKFVNVLKDRDVTVMKYEATIQSKQPLNICCEVFFELFRDQTNLLIVKTNNIEEGYRLDQSKSCISVEN